MFDTRIRFFLIGLLGVAAVFAWWDDHRMLSAGLSMVSASLVVGWLRAGSVFAAGRQFRARRKERALTLLRQTPFDGRFLARPVRAYFHLLTAACHLDIGDPEEVRRHGQAVLDMSSAGPHNHAAAHGALAQEALNRDDLIAARSHVEAARALPHKQGLKPLLARVTAAIEGR